MEEDLDKFYFTKISLKVNEGSIIRNGATEHREKAQKLDIGLMLMRGGGCF